MRQIKQRSAPVTDIDERELGPGRTAIVPTGTTRAVHRGPVQLRLIPPPGAFDTAEVLGMVTALGVDVAGISPQAIEQLNARMPDLMERLLADEDAAAAFDRDPGSFRDVLGDELTGVLITLRQRLVGMRSPINPPGSDESTRRPARRSTTRLVTARDPAIEERADTLREELLKWAVARSSNMTALEKFPRRTIEGRFADEPEAVRRALLREVGKGG